MKIKNCTKILLVLGTGVLVTACGGTGGKKGYYTYDTYLSTKPKTWNVHTWSTNDESYIQGFCSMGFYDLQLNEAKDGYEIITEMASDMPVDVSSQISNADKAKYGYPGSVSDGCVWEIPLNRAACWEDGTPIKAEDYVESMKRQLDPKMANYRADSYFSSSMVVANAERYFKQGNESLEEAFKYLNKDGTWTTPDACGDGKYFVNVTKSIASWMSNVFTGLSGDESLWLLFNQTSGRSDAVKLALQRVQDAIVYYCWKYCDHEGEKKSDWEEIQGYSKLSSVKEDMCNYDIELREFDKHVVKVRKNLNDSSEENTENYSQDAFKHDLSTIVTGFTSAWNKDWNWICLTYVNIYNDYVQEWGDEPNATSGVGVVAADPFKLRLYLAKPMTSLDLKFSLTGTWLVKNDLYDSLTTTTAAKKTTLYASPEKGVAGYMSYGPYKLTTYEAGKAFRMTKNDKWYGYSDGKHNGQFVLDEINTRIIEKHETALSEFLAGKLDDIELTRNDMKEYGASSRLTRTYESYTQKISFNSDRATLLKRQESATKNKTILANKNFREGLSLALDRKNFAAQATSGSKGFTGLLNDLYLTDVEDGEMYRNTPQGQSVYGRVYNKLGGNPFADVNPLEGATDWEGTPLSEDAIGYNMDAATYYVAKGLIEEFGSDKQGHIEKGASTKIDIEFRVYDNQSEATIEMYNFIKDKWNDVLARAVAKLKDTTVNGAKVLGANDNVSLEINLIKDEDYYNTATNGGYDMIFSTWGGAAINPAGLMEVYCKASFTQTCEYGFKGHQGDAINSIEIDANGNGTIEADETQTFDAWYTIMSSITETDERGSDAWNTKHQKLLNILSGLEAGILNRFEAVPLVARASSSMNSFKIENGSENYINLIGYGGVRHLKFNYDDAGWAAFVKKNKDRLSDLYKN